MDRQIWGLRKIYRRGYKYQKTGVMLSELVYAKTRQMDLFRLSPISKKANLMEVIDNINNKMGKNTIRIASQGIKQNWSMKRENMSQNYTTDWDELLCVL